jgi:hypothetical protein
MSAALRRLAAIVLGLVLAALPFIHARYGSAGHHDHDHHHDMKGVEHAYPPH